MCLFIGPKAFECLLRLLTTVIILLAIDNFLKMEVPEVNKARLFVAEMNKKYPSLYYHLELGNSWEEAALKIVANAMHP